MRHEYHIHALHGFLGSPEDWTFDGIKQMYRFHTYRIGHDFPILPFVEWAEVFNRRVPAQENILLGYSLGGRLGLHALLQNPKKWKAAIFLSTNPGLSSQEEKKGRLAMDEKWAQSFEKEPWNDLMQKWNDQQVFKHDPVIPRQENENDRGLLAAALRTWSLGYQNDLAKEISRLEMPILWASGEKDGACLKIAESLKFSNNKSACYKVPNAGHRILFDNTGNLYTQITQFIQNL